MSIRNTHLHSTFISAPKPALHLPERSSKALELSPLQCQRLSVVVLPVVVERLLVLSNVEDIPRHDNSQKASLMSAYEGGESFIVIHIA
jgi:hypothetical protein